MIRLTLRQFRTQGIVAGIVLVALAVLLLVTGIHIFHVYDTTVANCSTENDCSAAIQNFTNRDPFLQGLVSALVLIVPALIGIFWGAPLVARELETGTYRFAWTQSLSRTRWLATKLGVVGLASMITCGLVTLMATWWSSPFDTANANRFSPALFDVRALVPIGYGVFAFAVGVTAGILLRRTVPAMATTLVVYVAARLSMTQWIRPRLIAPVRAAMKLTINAGLNISKSPSGLSVSTNTSLNIPNVWVYSTSLVGKGGVGPSAAYMNAACPALFNNTGVAPVAKPTLGHGSRNAVPVGPFQSCIDNLARHYHEIVAYQPANRYWVFQWYETAVYVAAALVLAGLCILWVRRRAM